MRVALKWPCAVQCCDGAISVPTALLYQSYRHKICIDRKVTQKEVFPWNFSTVAIKGQLHFDQSDRSHVYDTGYFRSLDFLNKNPKLWPFVFLMAFYVFLSSNYYYYSGQNLGSVCALKTQNLSTLSWKTNFTKG